MHFGHKPSSPNLNQGVEAVRQDTPLFKRFVPQSNYCCAILLDCRGLPPIPGHVMGISQRYKRGRGVRRFGAKETQPLINQFETVYQILVLVYASSEGSDNPMQPVSSAKAIAARRHNIGA